MSILPQSFTFSCYHHLSLLSFPGHSSHTRHLPLPGVAPDLWDLLQHWHPGPVWIPHAWWGRAAGLPSHVAGEHRTDGQFVFITCHQPAASGPYECFAQWELLHRRDWEASGLVMPCRRRMRVTVRKFVMPATVETDVQEVYHTCSCPSSNGFSLFTHAPPPHLPPPHIHAHTQWYTCAHTQTQMHTFTYDIYRYIHTLMCTHTHTDRQYCSLWWYSSASPSSILVSVMHCP